MVMKTVTDFPSAFSKRLTSTFSTLSVLLPFKESWQRCPLRGLKCKQKLV